MTAPQTDATTDPQSIIAALQQRLDAALAVRPRWRRNSLHAPPHWRSATPNIGERIEHQAATIDVLKAMSASPGDPQPVFDLIVERRAICATPMARPLFEFDGTLIHFARRRASATIRGRERIRSDVSDAANPRVAIWPCDPGPARSSTSMIWTPNPVCIPLCGALTREVRVVDPAACATTWRSGASRLAAARRGGFSDSQIELLKPSPSRR